MHISLSNNLITLLGKAFALSAKIQTKNCKREKEYISHKKIYNSKLRLKFNNLLFFLILLVVLALL
jgi:hypothetical protein|tara:strand:+ start:2351 stop:2548 length:198 start_codon:yes stop_codon:yes gene_type:complete